MLRNEAYWFLRLGSVIERGDNTARLLDVKYYLLLPEGERGRRHARPRPVDDDPADRLGAHRLSAASIIEALKPWLIADLLIFRREMPRSLAASADETVHLLSELGERSGRQGEADRLARTRLGQLQESDIDTIVPGRAARIPAPFHPRQCRDRSGDRAAVQVRLMRLAVHYTTQLQL